MKQEGDGEDSVNEAIYLLLLLLFIIIILLFGLLI